jgi:hypothetical protein
MQAQLKVYCKQDGEYIGMVNVDTADMPEQLQLKVNKVILAHRKDCRYYADKLVKAELE